MLCPFLSSNSPEYFEVYGANKPNLSLSRCHREAPKHRELRAGAAVGDIQRSEREAPAPGQPLDQTTGDPVRHLPHRLLGQGEPDGEDAHPAPHRRKSMSKPRHSPAQLIPVFYGDA